jgi:hypothetical protein
LVALQSTWQIALKGVLDAQARPGAHDEPGEKAATDEDHTRDNLGLFGFVRGCSSALIEREDGLPIDHPGISPVPLRFRGS